MKKSLFLLVVLFAVFHGIAQEITTVVVPNPDTIKELLNEMKVPAMGIGIIENGELKSVQVEGKIQGNIDAPANTIFDVASLTKTITTLLTLQLVQNGDWNLDESLDTYWIDPDVQDDSFHKKLTTRHILAHRTGFPNWRWMNEDKKLAFQFEPGKKFQYSGEGFEYLRQALEKKFDTSLEKLADSLVFQPNGMKDSYLVWNKELDNTRFAGTHDKEGKAYEYEKAYEVNAADNLLTTIEDFGNLGVNVLNKKHLENSIYNEMISPQSEVREGINFGLGWIVFNNLPDDEYALFNAGSDTGVNALILLLPKSKRGLVVITNGDNGRGLAMKMIEEVFGKAGQEILGRF